MNVYIERRGALVWTIRTSTFSLRSHRDPFVFFTALPRFLGQKISMKCMGGSPGDVSEEPVTYEK